MRSLEKLRRRVAKILSKSKSKSFMSMIHLQNEKCTLRRVCLFHATVSPSPSPRALSNDLQFLRVLAR